MLTESKAAWPLLEALEALVEVLGLDEDEDDDEVYNPGNLFHTSLRVW